MSTWITITVADLKAYLVGAQVTALQTAALASGQSDPVEDIIDEISGAMRLEIASCDDNVLSATANSIPPELKAEACALIIEAAQPRLKLKLSDDQKDAANNARRKLERIATCKLKVSTPADPETTETAQKKTGVSVVKSRTQKASPTNMGGL
jgi:hypothetical protein